MLNRKNFLLILLSLLFSLGCAAQKKESRKIGISVQLWSVRNDVKNDFEGTLKKLKAIGFEGVEFAGYHQYSDKPEELKALLDKIGLKAAATHIRTSSIYPDNLQKTIDFHKKLGCKLLIIPGDGMFTRSDDRNKHLADVFNKASKEMEKHGLYCGYHNHAKELASGPKSANGKVWWDLFAERTDKRVVPQQDVGWTWVAGRDPVEFVKKYPGRTLTTHFKGKIPKGVTGKQPFINENGADWKPLIKACHEVGGTEWFSVEQEDYPKGMTPMQCVERSYKNLMALLKEMGYR